MGDFFKFEDADRERSAEADHVDDARARLAKVVEKLKPGEPPCDCCRPEKDFRCPNVQLCDSARAANGWRQRKALYDEVVAIAEGREGS